MNTLTLPLVGFKSIRDHLLLRNIVEKFVGGCLKESPQIPNTCHRECEVGKWIHSEEGRHLKNASLLDALCLSCENFSEAASQAVLLAKMGEVEAAQLLLGNDSLYSEASMQLQLHLEELLVHPEVF